MYRLYDNSAVLSAALGLGSTLAGRLTKRTSMNSHCLHARLRSNVRYIAGGDASLLYQEHYVVSGRGVYELSPLRYNAYTIVWQY